MKTWLPRIVREAFRQTYWHLHEARCGHFVVKQLIWECAFRLPEFTITRTTRHGRFSFSSKDAVIGRWLFVQGAYEHDLVEHAISVAAAGGHLSHPSPGYLLDVGANIGTVCIHLIRNSVFSGGIAIEPVPSNYSLLLTNLQLNSVDHLITAVNCAVSCASGSAVMELAPHNSGDCRIRGEGAAAQEMLMGEGEWRTINVPVYTIDELISRLGVEATEVKLLWMDVQGHERYVLEGADSLLKRAPIPVVTEFWPYGLARAGVTEREFLASVEPRFDSFYDLASSSPVRVPIAELGSLFEIYPGFLSSNLLLVPEKSTQ